MRDRPQSNPYRFVKSAVFTLAVGIASCSQGNETTSTANPTSNAAPSDPLEVVVSHNVLCDLTAEIAQETIDLNCLVAGGQDPHTYTSTPTDRQAIETADLVLYAGYNLIPGVEGIIEVAETDAPVVAVYEQAVGEPLLAEEHHHHEGEEHAHDHDHDHEEENVAAGEAELQPDPHVWLDVENAIASVAIIRDQLSAINPSQAELYAQNAQQLSDRLASLDQWVAAQIATIPDNQRTLITTHDAFGYYIEAYGLQGSEALQGLSSEEAPTASRVKELTDTIKATGVPTIFAEVTTSDRVIETVAREANVTVSEQELVSDGLGEANSETGTYIGMITSNTCAIAQGLGGQCTPFSE